MLRHTTLCTFVVVIMAMGSTYAQKPPGVCSDAELTGNAWGLCNAYCEAMDCDGNPNASGKACDQVAKNFSRATGGDMPPCYTSSAPNTPLPDTSSPPTGSQPGSCPCNFNLEFWTSQTQILPTSLPTCGTEPCITCQMSTVPDSTLLGVLVNLFSSTSPQEDSLFFFTTGPSSQAPGTCVSDGSFNSGDPITSLGDSLTSEQFSACVSDIGALQSAYATMCGQ